MARLLIVHHTPSPSLDALRAAVVDGAGAEGLEAVEVRTAPALTASTVDVLEADGYVLGTPANIGYMSGALKHFFDTIYYPCLHETDSRPWAGYVHGNDSTAGAVRAITSICEALGWRQAAAVLQVTGGPEQADLDAAWELGARVGAALLEG